MAEATAAPATESAAVAGAAATVVGKLAVGLVAGVFLALVVGGVTLWAINSGVGEPVAVAPTPQPTPQPSPTPPSEENPKPAPTPSPQPSPDPPVPVSATTPSPSPMPVPAVPEQPTPVAPMPVEPMPVQPMPLPPQPAATAVGALDDVRQRGKFLPLPPAKEVSAVFLCAIEVTRPTDCDLTLFGLDGLLPGGATGALKRSDPTPDQRVWTVTLKPTGNLTKERPVADFSLKDKQLSFRWRPSVAVPLDYCLLRIDAPGEQELCQLSQPLNATAAALRVQNDFQFSFKLPAGAANLSGCKLEILPQNFPPHMVDGDSTLESGKKTMLQVTGTASGTIEPAVDLEVEFTLAAGEATIKVASLAEHPPAGVKETASDRKGLNPKQLKASKERLDQSVIKAAMRVRAAEKLVDDLTAAEMRLMQGFQQQQLILVRMKLAQAENELAAAKNLHDRQSAALAWHDDILALIQQLETQATLGFRLLRPIGQDNVEIARTVP